MYPFTRLPPVAYIVPAIACRGNGPHGAVPGAVDGPALYIASLIFHVHGIARRTVFQIYITAPRICLRPLVGRVRAGTCTVLHLPIAPVIEIGIRLPAVEYLIIGSSGRRTGVTVIPGAVEIPAIPGPAEIGSLVSTIVEDKIGGGDIGNR